MELISKKSNDKIQELKLRLKKIDEERNKILSEAREILDTESVNKKMKIIKLDKHKGFNWAYFKSLYFSPYDYSIQVDMERGGRKISKNIKDVTIVDDTFKDIPIGKKIPKF